MIDSQHLCSDFYWPYTDLAFPTKFKIGVIMPGLKLHWTLSGLPNNPYQQNVVISLTTHECRQDWEVRLDVLVPQHMGGWSIFRSSCFRRMILASLHATPAKTMQDCRINCWIVKFKVSYVKSLFKHVLKLPQKPPNFIILSDSRSSDHNGIRNQQLLSGGRWAHFGGFFHWSGLFNRGSTIW